MQASTLYIAPGDAGIQATLRTMKREALKSVSHPEVIAWSHSVVRGVAERDPDAEAAAFLAWIRTNVRYTLDPVDVELVKTPQVMIREFSQFGKVTGDCDDQVTLLAAGLNIVGLETRFVVVAAEDGSPEYSHVLVEYLSPKRGWVSMDPIVRGTGPGWFPPRFNRLGRFEGGSLTTSGPSGFKGLIVAAIVVGFVLAFKRSRKGRRRR